MKIGSCFWKIVKAWSYFYVYFKKLRDKILELGYATEEELQALETQVDKDIEDAVEFAKNSPEPTLDTLEQDVYAD